MNDTQARHPYDNSYFENNVYGHVVSLLRRHVSGDARGRVHLDVGCGFGAIAEPIRQEIGLAYVGVDGSDTGLKRLAQRDFEVHVVQLGAFDVTIGRLREVIGGRRLASISLIDTLVDEI